MIDAAERALAAVGRPAHLDLVKEISEPGRRTKVVRCASVESNGVRDSVIIKQLSETEQDSPSRLGLLRDWSALALLTSIEPGHDLAPRLLAGDAAQNLIVLEDLGDGESLVEALLGSDEGKAEKQLEAAARVIARIHGLTIGQSERYDIIRSRLGPSDPSGAFIPAEWPLKIRESFARLGLRLSEDFATDAAQVLDEVRTPGPFFGLVHGDPCPDNWILTTKGLRLFDFEFSGFCYDGFALTTIDAVFPRMCFPSCWCAGVTPLHQVLAFEEEYRRELSRLCPAATDNALFGAAMSLACSAWILSTLSWQLPRALEGDREWGTSSLRPRILSRLKAYDDACAIFGGPSSLRSAARGLLDALPSRWPESDSLPMYPAFYKLPQAN